MYTKCTHNIILYIFKRSNFLSWHFKTQCAGGVGTYVRGGGVIITVYVSLRGSTASLPDLTAPECSQPQIGLDFGLYLPCPICRASSMNLDLA